MNTALDTILKRGVHCRLACSASVGFPFCTLYNPNSAEQLGHAEDFNLALAIVKSVEDYGNRRGRRNLRANSFISGYIAEMETWINGGGSLNLFFDAPGNLFVAKMNGTVPLEIPQIVRRQAILNMPTGGRVLWSYRGFLYESVPMSNQNYAQLATNLVEVQDPTRNASEAMRYTVSKTGEGFSSRNAISEAMTAHAFEVRGNG